MRNEGIEELPADREGGSLLHVDAAFTSGGSTNRQESDRSRLTRRGCSATCPYHWHCSRGRQGRQSRMRTSYATRRLLSASRRCSVGESRCPLSVSSRCASCGC